MDLIVRLIPLILRVHTSTSILITKMHEFNRDQTMKTFLSIFIWLAASSFLASCTEKEEKKTDLVTFPLRGEVVSIDTARQRIMIAHEEIPNYMMAMTMPFKVKDPALLTAIEPGDSVQATLAVSRTESWLENLGVIGRGETLSILSPGDIEKKHLLEVGDVFPDEILINQDERQIRFSDFKGRVLAVTFIYTRCPIPDFCIRMSSHFAHLQNTLTKDRSLDGKWHLLTISFDPRFDSPQVLRNYGKSYGADFAFWDFATDPDTSGQTILRLAEGLGLTFGEDGQFIAHNLRTVLIGKEGKLVSVIKGNDWRPEELAAEIHELVKP